MLLVSRFRGLSEDVILKATAKLERLAAANDELEALFRPFVLAVHNLLEVDSSEPSALLTEICLELGLSGRRFPWVRRS